jgi:hypothetical protein
LRAPGARPAGCTLIADGCGLRLLAARCCY